MTISFLDFFNNLISMPSLLVITILISAVMFINGCLDVPNNVATCVGTRSIEPKKALVFAAVFNFLGMFVITFISAKVAQTMFNIVNLDGSITNSMITLCSAMIGIVLWCIISWILGIPSSQSHALIAGLSGAAIALQGGIAGINFDEWKKVIYGLIFVNLIAFFLGFVITKIIEIICKNMDRRKTNKFFKGAQIFGAMIMCFMNGAQDGQKFVAFLLLGIVLSSGSLNSFGNFSIPVWLLLYCSSLIAVGAIIGGLRIIKTVGLKVAKVERYQGTAADISSAICLFASSVLGIPVSSTHTKNSAVIGVGASKGLSRVNWRVARSMVLTWLCTFPCCGFLGFIVTKILIWIFG